MDGDQGDGSKPPIDLGEEPWWGEDGAEGAPVPVAGDEHGPPEADLDRTAPGWPSMGERSDGGWWAGLDRGIRLLVLATVGIAVLVGLLAAAYVYAFSGAGVPQADPPQAGFDATYDPGADAVVVTHTGGETVATERLVVTVDGQQHTAWSATGEDLRVGDAITVRDVPAGSAVTVTWRAAEGDARVDLVTQEAA